MYDHKQLSQSTKDRVGKKPAMLSPLCTVKKNYRLVKKKGGKNLAFFFFNAPLLAIYNIMQSSMICNTAFKECIY